MKTKLVLLLCLIVFPTHISQADSFESQSTSEKKSGKEKSDTDKKDKDEKDKDVIDDEPPKIGNLSLRSSQQPGPLVGFGDHVIDKGEVLISLYSDAFIGNNNYRTDITPNILYGITDNFSIYFNAPFSPKSKDGPNTSSGIEDIFVQLEYSYYSKNYLCATEQATIVGGIFFPTGSSTKNPPTGYGSSGFLIGLTYNYTATDWFCFAASGFIVTTKHHNHKFGNSFLYQYGFGRNFCSPPGWIYAWMIELTGTYLWKDRQDGHKDPNSGGNVILATPSLWFSSNNFIFQIGAGTPIVQNLFGNQRKTFLTLFANISFTF